MLLQRLLLALCLVAVIGGGIFLFSTNANKVAPTPPPDTSMQAPAEVQTDVSKLPGPPGDTDEIVLPAPADTGAPGAPGLDLTKPTPTAPPAVAFEQQLGLPIAGLKATDIHDTFNDARGGGTRRHEAADIMAPRGTPVVAVTTGIVKKLFDSKVGGLTVYQFDVLEKHAYYYAHLDRYAENLKEGQLLKRGDKLGYVGSTGDAAPDAPHLHFGILQMGPEKKWYSDTVAINPYPAFMQHFKTRRASTP